MSAPKLSAGRSFPLGATVVPEGVNFCLYSKHADRVELLLFDRAEDPAASHAIALDPQRNRTNGYWHVQVDGIRAGQIYGYRISGPNDPSAGLRFDPDKLLLDPYALAVTNAEHYKRSQAVAKGDNIAAAFKCVVVDPTQYDWHGDRPLERPFVDSVIYELHVGGFTQNPNSGLLAQQRGTYGGVIEKIPYLVDLGIKTVELMPVQQFDAQAAPNGTNYWGYQPIAWFAPHAAYSSRREPLGPVDEFRDLVKALHRADIEVILDVVFNHTAEGDASGPTLSLRGIDNPTYYILDAADRSKYVDDTGCGNTVRANEPVVRQMIVACLRYWVEHMHVDGFRFDLAASMARGDNGEPLAHPPILLDIDADPVLAGTKIIAEAWDAAGLYQLANFPGDRWAVWNGRFRDTVRQFIRGDAGSVGQLGDCLVASATYFHQSDRVPSRSVNFVTAHDGFTLNDLVSYDDKHNEANGEKNRDGSDDNFSWNCGTEGPTNDVSIESLRRQQIKNFLTILLLSEGRPMLLMGDEVRRTQQGNNNAYCQDNPISWFDWSDVERHADVRRFVRELIHFHQGCSVFRDRSFWGEPDATRITWHGVKLAQPQWGEDSHALAYELTRPDGSEHLHIMLNAYWKPLAFELPAVAAGRSWQRVIDTSLASPNDFANPPVGLTTAGNHVCQPRSSVVLIDRATAVPPR